MSKQEPEIILASESPYRAAVLKSIKIPFSQLAPKIDETPQKDENIKDLVLRLAQQKAAKVLKNNPDAIIIASDQSAYLNINGVEVQLTKPNDFQTALNQLMPLAGREIDFFTSICVLYKDKSILDYEIVKAKFKNFSAKEARLYLELDEPYDCAAGLKVESLGINLLERVRADDPNTLIGLPLIKTIKALETLGFSTLDLANRFNKQA